MTDAHEDTSAVNPEDVVRAAEILVKSATHLQDVHLRSEYPDVLAWAIWVLAERGRELAQSGNVPAGKDSFGESEHFNRWRRRPGPE